MKNPARSILIIAAASVLASGCAATKNWWYDETGRMTAQEAAAHGHPECADLTMSQCQAKGQKEAARKVPEGTHPGGQP